MRVLVTGHTGYIGPIMMKVLSAAGHTVEGVDINYFFDGTATASADGVPRKGKDVRDIGVKDLEGIGAIVHLAGLSNDPLGELQSDWTHRINTIASVRLAEKAREAGVERFLFASSCSMYGAAGADFMTEEAPLRPLTQYAVSKVRVEEALLKLADDHFTPVFLRNSTVYGMSPHLRTDLVLNNLVGWAHTTGKVVILSDGTPWRPIVHVEDVCLAFAAALSAPREAVHCQAFNVGITSENYQVKDLAEIVRETVPGCRIEYAGDGGPDPRSYRVDFGKLARTLTDFKPRWTARLGARELYDAYLAMGLTAEAFQGRPYVRLKQLKHLIDTGRLDGDLAWREGGSEA